MATTDAEIVGLLAACNQYTCRMR